MQRTLPVNLSSPVGRGCSRATPSWERIRLGLTVVRFLTACVSLSVLGGALGQEPAHPLEPPDRASPRAALRTFLEQGDGLGAFLVRQYLPDPSRSKYQQAVSRAHAILNGLDVSEVPAAARTKTGRAAGVALYETLSRIPLPPFEEIPDAGTNVLRWVIPHTEIALTRMPSGPHQGAFLFSTDTVKHVGEFYARVRHLPYMRSVPLEHLAELLTVSGGWMIPPRWLQALPEWLRRPLAGQSGWKWVGLAFLLSAFSLLLRIAYRLSQRGRDADPLLRALAQTAVPVTLLLATPGASYVALVQLNLLGGVGVAVEVTATAVMFLAGAWICWRLAPVVAEAIIASPNIPTESIDAHLIRIFARLLGMIAGATLLVVGADRIGVPVYGIVAGLGVGGLAIALAAQPTVENLIGGLSLFADKPVRVGDTCRYGDEVGTVESIGIRSTRMRGPDRTLTTIPNATLSKMSVTNLTLRDRLLIKAVIGVRYETNPEQLRHLLVKLRELLARHPRVHPDPARVRFVAFGAYSLDLEVFAYVTTSDWNEFLAIREDLFLRMMDLVQASGSGFAFPSQTLYLGRDGGLDAQAAEAAQAEVRQWREQGELPFPDFSPEQLRQMRGTLDFPLAESLGHSRPASGATAPLGIVGEQHANHATSDQKRPV